MSETARYDVAGTGSMVVDLVCFTPHFIGEDQKVLLGAADGGAALRQLVGGVALNHLGWASLLGARCAIFGKQADDAQGRFLRQGMARLGIAEHIDRSGSASSLAHVYVDPRGGRAIYMMRGATGELTPQEIDERHGAVIDAAAWVTSEVSQVPLAAVLRVFERARKAGARTVLDLDVPLADAIPGLGSEAELHAVFGATDLLKASSAALAGLVRSSEPMAIAGELADRYGIEHLALTRGAAGAVLIRSGKDWSEPAPAVTVRDTTGAGDAFLGGLLAGLCRGLAPGDALKLATSAAACCCERAGGFPDEPDACRDRTLALYAEASGAALPKAESSSAASGGELPSARFARVASEQLAHAARGLDAQALRRAAELILTAEQAGGRVHVTGIGKPEHVARYSAALLSSTGTPASFLHGTEATHGSLGQLREQDVLIAISNSGETAELLECVLAVRTLGARVIAVTGGGDSALARAADLLLEASVDDEGGPLGLAPRASILVEVLVLQALSVELQEARGFTRADYHARHPQGTLGKRSKS
jgi:arabinose-5-phosphate isomerase